MTWTHAIPQLDGSLLLKCDRCNTDVPVPARSALSLLGLAAGAFEREHRACPPWPSESRLAALEDGTDFDAKMRANEEADGRAQDMADDDYDARERMDADPDEDGDW